jgi:hypothetical protein
MTIGCISPPGCESESCQVNGFPIGRYRWLFVMELEARHGAA